jgi:hypothetical protein
MPVLATYLFSAKGAVFILAWGNAPGISAIPIPALKARFIPMPESRLQRFVRIRSQVLGRCPRLFNEEAPLALNRYLAARASTLMRRRVGLWSHMQGPLSLEL